MTRDRRTWTEGHVMDGSTVAVDLLQCGEAGGVPDGDGSVLTARNQQRPSYVQAHGVHLEGAEGNPAV